MRILAIILFTTIYLLLTSGYFLWVIDTGGFAEMPLYLALMLWAFVISAWSVVTWLYYNLVTEL